jgi:hypothetical protein
MAVIRHTSTWEFALLGVALLCGGWFWARFIAIPKEERRWPAWVVGRAILATMLAVFALIHLLR